MSEEREMRELLLTTGVPQRYLACSWETFTMDADGAAEFVRSWSLGETADPICFLSGPPGIGKTHLAVSVMRGWLSPYLGGSPWETGLLELMENGDARHKVFFLNAGELMRQLASVSFQDAERGLLLNAGMPMLVLDDLLSGQGKLTEHVAERLSFLINYRYDRCLPTLVTSNENLDGVREFLGPRVASRLADGLVVYLTGDDRRLR